MKKIHVIIGFTIIGILMVGTRIQKRDFLVLKNPYLGQEPQDRKSKIFTPGIISTSYDELFGTVTPDRKYFFFTSNKSEDWDIYLVDAKIFDELKPNK